MRRSFITLILLLAGGSTCLAEGWAADMFGHSSYDFGVVARGQEAEHRFPLENLYEEDVCLRSVQSSCTCIMPKITKGTLKTHEKGEIVAVVDTRKFLGRKESTFRIDVTCSTAQGLLQEEVQLHCYAYIRSDVVLEPGSVQFGSVPFGQGAPAKRISITYAGRDDWKIVRAECDNPHLDLQLNETGRHMEEGTWRVTYDLSVGLKADAPVGYLRAHVMLVTNDRNEDATRVAVSVEGSVVPTVSVKPSPLMLGLISPGQEVERTLVVRGKTPFRIVEAAGPSDQFRFQFSDQPRILHPITVTFTAGKTPGKVTGTIRLQTDLTGNDKLEVQVDGRVIAPGR
jgi:hypothetical protein